jgi:5-methylthioadenosine/S-adenosylhomocysteine deaminase
VEQLLAGVTTTTDMYFFEDEVGAVLDRAGMRAVIGESLMERPTPSCASTEEMVERQRELVARYADHPLITPAIASHAPYSVSAPNLVLQAELAEELDVPLQVHLAETRWEVDTLLKDKGVSPVAYLADLGILSERVVAAHCVHVSPEDIELLAEFEVGVAHNPVSNLKLASGVSPVTLLLAGGVEVGLGTDGPASNNTLDLLRDLQVAALLHKGVTGDPTVLPARTLVELATAGGARVLGLGDRIGTLAPGFEADLVCLDITGAHATPLVDPFSHLVFSARSGDVRHVLVRGRRVVADRRVQTLDEDEVKARARETAARFST